MSATASPRGATSPASLHLLPSTQEAATTAWRSHRPPVLRVCAGEALLLTDAEVDLVALVNRARDITTWLLDDSASPNDYRLAEVLLEHVCHRYGIQRIAKGDRVLNLESAYRRHLLPFLIELDASLPEGQQGVAAKRLRHLERLPAVLAGDEPLPAATVAGEQLGRRGVACIFLSLNDAAAVTRGGANAVHRAIEQGRLPVHADTRTGEEIIRSADLRADGLLMERETAHGLARSTAGNVLRDLKLAMGRARDHGADIRGQFDLVATEPLAEKRLREPRQPASHVTITETADTARWMPPTGQAVLWCERLTGVRISEGFGARVHDYWRDQRGQGWLGIDKQGGRSTLSRDPSGQFVSTDTKDHTKTEAGTRVIPLPFQLADLFDQLIAIFHTDAETGEVDAEARLIPGIQRQDTSGQSSYRTWLRKAQTSSGACFKPHDLRGALITDLLDAGIDERLAHHFAGHELHQRSIQTRHYDRGPAPELLLPIARHLENLLAESGHEVLRAPTGKSEQWGRGTRRYRQQDWIHARLRECGWLANGGSGVLTCREVAARIGKSESGTRKLMSTGVIASSTQQKGERTIWVASDTDVQAYLDRTGRISLADLAAELDLSYHQLWNTARELQLLAANHIRGSRIDLTHDTEAALRAEVTRRRAQKALVMSVQEAAAELRMQVGLVETLIRQQHLELVPGPTTVRRRHVTRESVHAYAEKFPPPDGVPAAPGDPLLSCTQAARLARVTRPQLTKLLGTFQVTSASKGKSRHVYVTASSLLAWAERTGQDAVAATIREHLARS